MQAQIDACTEGFGHCFPRRSCNHSRPACLTAARTFRHSAVISHALEPASACMRQPRPMSHLDRTARSAEVLAATNQRLPLLLPRSLRANHGCAITVSLTKSIAVCELRRAAGDADATWMSHHGLGGCWTLRCGRDDNETRSRRRYMKSPGRQCV